MTKRQVTKKEPKLRQTQKQKQQQNVVVNIGTIAKKRKPRQTKPKQQPKSDVKPVEIITRGPNTYFQQSQPVQPQPNINELFRLIQQQQKVSVPEPPAVGGTFLNPVSAASSLVGMQPAASSIVPELAAVAEPKRENELEKIRKARTEKFTTPAIELKTPALIRVVEEENAGLGLEDKAYQGLKEQPTKMKVVFDQAAQDELQLSIFGEADPGASINLHPAEIIAPNQVKPNIDLPASELLSPPATKGLNFRNALRGLVSEARENKDFFETAESENWPVIDVKQDRLRELREQRLAAIKTTLKPKEEPKSLVSQVEQETDIVEEGTEPIITSPDPAASSLAGGQPVDVELAFAFPSPAAIEPPVAEEKSAITELNLGEQKQEPEPEPTAPVYKGGKLLPAIIQPVATDPVIKQLFAPRVEPSLAEAIGTEVVRPADVYTTETLVKGLPEAEATDAPTGKPKEQLIAFAKSLGVDTSSGIANKHLRTAEIQQRIRDKMGTDYEIPVFKARKPGPQKAPAIAEALTITDV